MGFSSKKLISIVIPSFNDNEIILPYYRAIRETLDNQTEFDFELIYVDDGSSDNSIDTLSNLARNEEKVIYIEFFRNFGQQPALFAGLLQSKGDYVITLDGDYQYHPSIIIELIEAMGNRFDMASGIRINRQDPLIATWFSRLGNIIYNRILGGRITDFGSVKVFSRNLVNQIIAHKHRFSDVYSAAVSLRPSTVEVEVEHLKRPVGSSHWTVWMKIKLYAELYMYYSHSQFDIPFLFGVIMTVLGFATGLSTCLWSLFSYNPSQSVPILLVAFSLFLCGFFITAWSFTMALLLKIYKQNAHSAPYNIRRIIQKGQQESTDNDT